MVGIQFIMTMSFSFLSPIMPLFLPDLGVTTDAGIALWSGILNGSTSFVAAFASRRYSPVLWYTPNGPLGDEVYDFLHRLPRLDRIVILKEQPGQGLPELV